MTANLIPLQLDQSTGNLVAAPISSGGSYFPPSGTGFQFVTSGVPTLSAFTATQATAFLNLFTPSLQGLVPPSGGGTTTFLRADGTFAAISAGGVTTFNTRTGAVTLTLSDVTTALNFTPYNATNPAGYLAVAVTSAVAGAGISVSGATGAVTFGNTGVLSFNTRTGAVVLSSADVTTALTFTPYNATNPSGFISAVPAFTANGDVSGTFVPGSPGNLPLTLPNIATAGTFHSVTVNAKGQVTTGTNPTTLAGYGITDAGTVTTVSVVTANGISGSVSSPTIAPAITLALGAITPTSVNASGTIAGSNFSGSSSGTNTGDQNVPNPIIKTVNYTALPNDMIIVDTTSGPITITLPAVPVFGNVIKFIDGAGTWNTNNLTVNGNGANILGSATTLVSNLARENFTLIYYNTAQGWILGT